MRTQKEVAVIVPTFGNKVEWWGHVQNAVHSVVLQSVPCQIVWHHADYSLQEARNVGASKTESPWLIFLDADDTLDSHYVERMLAGEGDIRRPSLLGVSNGREDHEPTLLAEVPIEFGNYIPIGAMLRHDQFNQIGGFDDWPILEDWDLFIRLIKVGARVSAVPGAIYRVNVREGSRNSDQALHDRTYGDIRHKHFPPIVR